ncbi:MAG: hypothetical protein IKX75_03815, partial [Desulfovibrio sp.]|nr:hypothetical protein [Desulfovibrio sp.]
DLGFAAKCAAFSVVMFAAVMLGMRYLTFGSLIKLPLLGIIGAAVYFILAFAAKKFSLKALLEELVG